MKKYLSKILPIALVVALLFNILVAPTVYAAIASPDTQTINSIEAFRGVLEEDDQLYIVTFSLEYTTNPVNGAGDNFLFRLTDNGTEIAAVAPFAFNNAGYDDGVISFYFEASDANIPVWQTANLTVQFVGNPALTWTAGNPPLDTNNIINSFTDGNQTVPTRIRLLATALEAKYAVDMIEVLSGVLYLTSIGASYFETVIQNLRYIAPDVFSDIISKPEFDEREFTNANKTTSEARWLGDSVLDFTDLGTLLGVPRMWATSIIYIIFSIAILIFITVRIGAVRPATFLFGAMMVIGSFSGLMVFEAGIFAGVAGALAIVFTIFYRGAP
tara:strand:+ start:69 stop:1055 length:987 start_codon:yes stop_codon:yes gene_type:complete